ncbi:hypothetical protein D3C80_1499760 [compost metagenome]
MVRSCSSVCSVPSPILLGSMPKIKTLAGPAAPRNTQFMRFCMMPPPAIRPSPASAPMAIAIAVEASGSSIEAATMTVPKLEAGSGVAPASVRHQFSVVQDFAKTWSVRAFGRGQSSLAAR